MYRETTRHPTPSTGIRRGDSVPSCCKKSGELLETQFSPDPKRLADGWEFRFVTDAQRVEEMAELYRQLGCEVCVDPMRREDLEGDCEDCALVMLLQFKTIYTRKKRP